MASTSDIQIIITAALQQQAQQLETQLASRDEAISKLMEKVELKEAETSSKPSPKINKGKKKAQPDQPPVANPIASTSARKSPKSRTPTKSNQPASHRTPSGSQPKRVVTPKSSSPRVCPFQMVSRAMPESFTSTRDALYVHLKLIWNLLEQKAIPGPPHPDTLREFNSHFSNAKQIEKAAEDENGASIIPTTNVSTLKKLQAG
ncbi:hypothetical protein PtA15_13A161 [Puccinia triticina]|nr:uncharacterized protein PtA15_13A161 [Puccinia triticina]WAQ90762.1 hypothetical protein PtA15_13A161 [Puccinia triticina]WAR60945.1 hypothetical protein PtB15_13B196 [Puccinia triticina]